jgi:hypothetical protein
MSVSNMSVSNAKSLTVVVAVAMGMLASEAALFATAAQADPNRNRGHGYDRPVAPRHFDRRSQPEPRHDRREQHRDRSGDAVAATVLGLGALIVGAAVSDAARRNRNQRYEPEED